MTKHQPPSPRLEDLKPGTEWTSVPGFARYWVSRTGLVAYEDDLHQFRIKVVPKAQSGHRVMGLTHGDTKRSVNLIRLMAEVFLGPPPSTSHKWVKPIDGNIDNVAPENLSWTDVGPGRGKKKQTRKTHAEKTKLATQIAKSGPEAVAEKTGLPLTYVRHLKPDHVYEERDRSSPDHVSKLQFTPPADPNVEEWRAIPEAPGYDVSSFGRIRSWRGLEVHIQSPVLGTTGYLRASLQLGHKGQSIQTAVHRLVAMAFCPRGRLEQLVVNHKDKNGDRLNNHYLNLEWSTDKENSQHAHDSGLWKQGETHGQRWFRPPVGLYDRIRASDPTLDTSPWRAEVVEALKQHLGWADQTPGSLPGEQWKPVEDRWSLATAVEVSNRGRVRRTSNLVLLLQGLSTHGYPLSRLYGGNGSSGSILVKTHTLVAEAFLGRRPSTRHVVNHKDRNKQNNAIENLEWSTYRENSKHWAASRAHTVP